MNKFKQLMQCLMKFLILSTLISIFLWKAFEAYDKYHKGDTMMITRVEYPEEQTFPSITLCRSVIAELLGEKNLSEVIKYNSKLDNWLNSTFGVDGIVDLQLWKVRHVSQLVSLQRQPVFCYTLDPPKMVPAGMNNTLQLAIKSRSYDFLFILLHDAKNSIPVFGDIFGATTLALPVVTQVEQFYSVYLSVSANTVVSLSTEVEPCDEVNSNTTLCSCIEKYFQETGGCILNWYKDHIDSIQSYNSCKEENLVNFGKFMDKLIAKPSFREVYKVTGCIPKCDQTSYSYKKSMEVSVPMNHTDSIVLGLYLTPSGVTMKKELLVLDALEIIGNVGGYLGLLLGWSVMSIVQLYFKTK